MEGDTLKNFNPTPDPASIGVRWKRWMTQFEFYADGKGLIIHDGEGMSQAQLATHNRNQNFVKHRRKALLLHLAGTAVQDIFSTLVDTGEVSDYQKAVDALNNHFCPKVNSTFSRQKFHSLRQQEGETIQQFATRLRTAVRDCDYQADEADNQIRDAILWRCQSEPLKRKMLEEGQNLMLVRTLEMAQQIESIDQQLQEIHLSGASKASPSQATVNAVQHRRDFKRPQKSSGKKFRCYRCDQEGHFGKDPTCPARDAICDKCHIKGHFAIVCKTKDSRIKQKPAKPNRYKTQRKVNTLQDANAETENTGDYVFSLRQAVIGGLSAAEPKYEQVCVGSMDLNMMIDSGADANVIDRRTWESMKAEKVKCISQQKDCTTKLYPYGSDQPLETLGVFRAVVEAGSQSCEANFVVIQGQGVPILGRDTAMKLNLLKVGPQVNAVNMPSNQPELWRKQYPTAFQGLGKVKDRQIHLHIDESVPPVVQPYRRTPYGLRDRVDEKINDLIKNDVIEEVSGPTPWVNPVVVTPKPGGDIRLCLDMRRANEAILRERHPIPTVDEVLQNMNGSKVFTKLDLKWGYHQLELDEESRVITTFQTHNGLYRYKRLLFGVNAASEVYQYEMRRVLAGIPGVDNISDDIIVHAPDTPTHDKRLHEVFKRIIENDITLNPDKCEFAMDRLVFMGLVVSQNGVGPTEERVKAVMEAREPATVSEVRSFLGLVNFSARFIPNHATLAEPLRKLTRKEEPFVFGPEQMKAFEALKHQLCKTEMLGYFDKDAKTTVIADAGPTGLGAVLTQRQGGETRVIQYASRSLTDVERRYSQTEKEALALVWACERFHLFLYGTPFDLVTDHKPLQVIYGPRSKPSARVERWVLRMQPYNFKVVYVPGHRNVADSLSRLVQAKNTAKHEHGAEEYVRFITVNATPWALTTSEIEVASAEDDELRGVRDAIQTGRFDQCKGYSVVASELCTIGQIVLRGTRIVLPTKLRSRAVVLAH